MKWRVILPWVTWISVGLTTVGMVGSCLALAQERTVITTDGKGRITALGPRLSPAEAAAVLTRSVPPARLAQPATAAPEGLAWPTRPSTYRPGDGPFGPFPASPYARRPLNCCGTYSIPLPYPTIRILKD